MPLYQIIVPILCFLLICKAGSDYSRHHKTIREFIVWVLFWGALGLIAIFPDSTGIIAGFLGIKSNVNAIIFTALIILFYTTLKLVILNEEQERQLTKLTRALALKENDPKQDVQDQT